jgi:signal transduction histidine kinase/CheY-like chemotaxis protein
VSFDSTVDLRPVVHDIDTMPTTTHTRLPGDSVAPGPPSARNELLARRRRITHALLVTFVVLGGVAYLPSMWAAIQVEAWWIAIMDTAVYGVVVYAFLHRGLDHRIRAGIVVGAAALLGVTLSAALGPNGAGALWLCAVPVLTALLFGRRETVWSLVLVAAVLAVVAALRAADLVAWEMTPGGVLLWLVIAGNTALIAGGLGVAVATLIGGLTEAAERTERYGAALAREQEALLEANDRLQRASQERARAEARLRQSEKLTAIGTLASGIAHDMNNLLVPILGGAELLRSEERDETSERARILDETINAARAAGDLVGRILSFSRPRGEGRTTIDAGSAFRDSARLLQAAIPPDVELTFRADPEAGAVVLSAAEVHQIMLNLGGNAAQAMPEGGRLVIAVDPVPYTGPAATAELPAVEESAPYGFVRLSITDTGVGMDEETMNRMFEPFFTRSRGRGRQAEGHGIGLATVYGIVTSAGGFIIPHSQPGAGTTMEVFLPRAARSASPTVAGRSAAATSAAPVARGRGERILVVDDDPDVLLLAGRILERAGYRPEAAGGADAALRMVHGDRTFDLVITDLDMPGTDGLELTRALHAHDPDLPVLLMSGLVDAELRRRAEHASFHTVLSKPFGMDDLVSAVAAGLALHKDHARPDRD